MLWCWEQVFGIFIENISYNCTILHRWREQAVQRRFLLSQQDVVSVLLSSISNINIFTQDSTKCWTMCRKLWTGRPRVALGFAEEYFYRKWRPRCGDAFIHFELDRKMCCRFEGVHLVFITCRCSSFSTKRSFLQRETFWHAEACK